MTMASNIRFRLERALGRGTTLALLLLSACAAPAAAHPEFQKSIVARTHRPVNCAYCHTNSDGPEGTAPGQIGRLSPSELEQLGRARGALLPGAGATNPILNAFGNEILNSLGKARILELRLAPDQLANELPASSDLDHDGISDAQEYRDGTHPLLNSDGDPRKLFIFNFRRSATELILVLLATVLGLYGLRHLLLGFEIASRRPDPDDPGGDNASRRVPSSPETSKERNA